MTNSVLSACNDPFFIICLIEQVDNSDTSADILYEYLLNVNTNAGMMHSGVYSILNIQKWGRPEPSPFIAILYASGLKTILPQFPWKIPRDRVCCSNSVLSKYPVWQV